MPFQQYGTWSRADFKSIIRREVMDTNTRWVSDDELNLYLDLWLNDLQQEFEFVYAINTLTVGTHTGSWVIDTNTFTPPMLRCEAIYYDGYRLSGRLLQNLEVGNPLWRNLDPDTPRAAVMYPDARGVLIWPTPQGTDSAKAIVFEYPPALSFATDTSTSGMPLWTQWCAKYFVASKIFQRHGPISDAKKALRYAAQYERAKGRVRRLWTGFMPERARQFRPGGHYEGDILMPPPAFDVGTNTATGT